MTYLGIIYKLKFKNDEKHEMGADCLGNGSGRL